MTTSTSTRERRDWTLLIFIIPIGIILMLIAGQFAIRLVPIWSINAGMQSRLDPNNLPKQQSGLLQPIVPAILTPLGWLDTFLTPGADSDSDVLFPPFVVFEPTATPVVTASPPPTVITQPPTIPVTGTPTVTASPPVTTTKKPPTDTPPTSRTPTATATTTAVPITSTPVGTQVTPVPTVINIGTPDPDNMIYNLPDGNFIVIDLGTSTNNQIYVNGPSETNYYDMVYYEWQNPTDYISMDQVIIGISQFPDGNIYYTVFNWGNNIPDMNSNVSNVDGIPGTEDESDNQLIATTYLYGTTGITIDVDNAPSAPPIGWYQYIVIQAPITSDGDGVDIDAIQIIEVQISPSPAASVSVASVAEAPIQPAAEVPAQLAVEVPSSPADNAPSPPADNAPSPPADNAPSPPADNAPSPPADNAPSPPADNAPSPPADNAPSSP